MTEREAEDLNSVRLQVFPIHIHPNHYFIVFSENLLLCTRLLDLARSNACPWGPGEDEGEVGERSGE